MEKFLKFEFEIIFNVAFLNIILIIKINFLQNTIKQTIIILFPYIPPSGISLLVLPITQQIFRNYVNLLKQKNT